MLPGTPPPARRACTAARRISPSPRRAACL
nr:MAG TPA: hypothetical protein [Caudoviricetes sp.]DAR56406.1 MAG TPA: hypothetical protein [Caudoviricetes sp.]